MDIDKKNSQIHTALRGKQAKGQCSTDTTTVEKCPLTNPLCRRLVCSGKQVPRSPESEGFEMFCFRAIQVVNQQDEVFCAPTV